MTDGNSHCPNSCTERLHDEDDASRLSAEHADRVEDLDIHSFRLHALKGDLKGYWAIVVRANWRVVFRFESGEAFDIDLVDYH